MSPKLSGDVRDRATSGTRKEKTIQTVDKQNIFALEHWQVNADLLILRRSQVEKDELSRRSGGQRDR